MLREDLLLRTKLAPPRLQRRVLARPGLEARLQAALDYRLTIVQAGPGYGKTTALAALQRGDPLVFWYTAGPGDADPLQFLSYLIGAFRVRLPGLSQAPWAILAEISAAGGAAGPYAAGQWLPVVDALVNVLAAALDRPGLLVIDDFHLASDAAEIQALLTRFITYAPVDLHTILSTRRPPFASESAWLAWRARGEVQEIDRSDLAFAPDEIAELFRTTYGMALRPAEVTALADKTEGWPVALQMVWQGLQRNRAWAAEPAGERDLAALLAQTPTPLASLFDYLARDVLAGQPAEVAAFLRATAVLRDLTPAACDAVTGRHDSEALLARLHEMDLFLVALGDGRYRYHHVFHDFLRQAAAADGPRTTERHCRAAAYFQDQAGDRPEAIYHWLSGGAFREAGAAIVAESEVALQAGLLDTLAGWIDALPPAVVADQPRLQACLGDVYRLRSRFEEALAWYAAAERTCRTRADRAGLAWALRGQALVYLDTVRPAQAEDLLAEALRISDGLTDREARARLMDLLAENKLNMGKPAEAEDLRGQARRLREEGPGEDVLSVRVRLRTGRLDEAQRILEDWAEQERAAAEQGLGHAPRAHRETVLILSLVLALRGEPGAAAARAQEGIDLGQRLGSPFITAVGRMRLGHARQLAPPSPDALPTAAAGSAGPARRDEAIRCYQSSIALGDQIAVRRTRAEAMWGLTRACGFFPAGPGTSAGDLEQARRAAAEGVEIGRWAGDPWIVSLIELTLGGSYVLAGQPAAGLALLGRSLIGFRDCGDTFGRAAARLWLSLAHLELRQAEHFTANVEELLALCEAHGYDFLLSAPSLLGPPDPRRLVPLLLEARRHGHRPAYVGRVLQDAGLAGVQVHPGYQLRVQTLGAFHVWRGETPVAPREWQRDKARQLFQLLLTQRGRPLQRDEIVDRLWPDLAPDAALRDFKVALNALNRAVEPGRANDAAFAFVVREGTTYALRGGADLWVDSVAFERECELGLPGRGEAGAAPAIAHLQAARRLYAGDYLPDALYEDWATEERERLLSLYLRAADRLAALLLEQGQYDEALDTCSAILGRDACWERAYRMTMLAYSRLGNRPLALRAYQRCVTTLASELAVAPSRQTIALYEQIAAGRDQDLTAG